MERAKHFIKRWKETKTTQAQREDCLTAGLLGFAATAIVWIMGFAPVAVGCAVVAGAILWLGR